MTHPIAVCAGEVTVDLISRDGGPAERHVGGSPVNVAAGLQFFGIETTIWSAVGADENGRLALDQIQALGLSTQSIAVDPQRPTRQVHIEIDAQGARTIRPAPGETADQFVTGDTRPEEVDQCRIFYFSGAALISPVRAQSILEAATSVRARGDTFIAFDPNIRLGSTPAAEAIRARLRQLLSLADVVQFDSGRALDYWPDGESLGLHNATLIVETHGDQGAVLRAGEQSVEVRPVPTPVVDTTGAGDAFFACLLAQIAGSGHTREVPADPGELRTWGNAAATAAARVVGSAGGTTAYLSSAGAAPS